MHQLPHARTCLGCSAGSDISLIEYIYLKILLNQTMLFSFFSTNDEFLVPCWMGTWWARDSCRNSGALCSSRDTPRGLRCMWEVCKCMIKISSLRFIGKVDNSGWKWKPVNNCSNSVSIRMLPFVSRQCADVLSNVKFSSWTNLGKGRIKDMSKGYVDPPARQIQL